MQKSIFFKGFAIVNFVFFVALFLLYQTGKLDRFFTAKEKTPAIDTAQTEDTLAKNEDEIVSDMTTLPSSKSISISVAKPEKVLGAIKTAIESVSDSTAVAIGNTRKNFIKKDIERFYIKKMEDSIEPKKRVFMSSSKSYIIDGPRVSSGNLPPALDIDSLVDSTLSPKK